MWDILWGFNVRDFSGFFLHWQKSSELKWSRKNLLRWRNYAYKKRLFRLKNKMMQIRNETFRNETMKLPLVHTGVATKKRGENDRL